MKRLSLHIVLFLLSFSVYSQELTESEKVMGLSMLWQEANYNFAFFDQVESLDWDAEYMSALDELSNVKSDFEYYQLLKRVIAKLNDGHTDVYYPEQIENDIIHPSIDLFNDDGDIYITSVPQGLRKQIPVGAQLLKVNGVKVSQYLAKEVYPYISSSTIHAKESFALDQLFDGRRDKLYEISFQTPDGKKEKTKFRLTDRLQKPVNTEEPTVSSKLLSDDLYYVSLSSFEQESVIDDFKALIGSINESKGLVLDLRENIGGLGVVALNVAQHFILDDELITMPWKSRQHIASLKAWGNSGLQLVGYETVEKYKDFGGLDAWVTVESDTLQLEKKRLTVDVPVVILTSERTASAAENFLIYTNQNNTIQTLGITTFGSTGQPIYFTLPGGAIGRICTKRNFDIDGSEFVGYGIEPNHVEPFTLADRLNGIDSQLLKAVELLKE